jgi:hypothetical protein
LAVPIEQQRSMSPAEMDSDKVELEAADAEEYTASGEPKACTDCYTTKTPLWRGGPTGPKVSSCSCSPRLDPSIRVPFRRSVTRA